MNSFKLINEMLQERILVADGAMGTFIQSLGLSAQDFGGAKYEGCNEHLSLTRPDVISRIHCEYLEAGADIIETNTFGATGIVLDEYGLQDKTREINVASARLAAECAKKYSRPSRPKFVAGSMGPTTKSLFVTGGVSFDELSRAYMEQALALIEGGVDILFLETVNDILNVKAGLAGIEKAFAECAKRLPVMVSVTMDTRGVMLSGQAAEAAQISLGHYGLLSLGYNCGTGADHMPERLKVLSSLCGTAVSCMPNAGLPDENGKYSETPKDFTLKMERFADEGWVNIAGGCCGTTPRHIRLLANAMKGKPPRGIGVRTKRRWAVCGIEPLFYDEITPPVLAGERTNSIGSRQFRQTIAAGKWDEAVETARGQVKGGAQILDVCLANPERDELGDMVRFLSQLVKAVRVPIMIDTTDLLVAEAGLKICPGRCIINSVNLEFGEAKLEKAARLAKTYGAALVVGCIDENKKEGMAFRLSRKTEIAERAFKLLTGKYGIRPEDIIFDALVFPAASGDSKYAGGAMETIETLKAFKALFPQSKTVLGISNVSFGLPQNAREVLNSVFLYQCIQSGLDIAIVNTQGVARYPDIPEKERALAEAVLLGKDPSAAGSFADVYRRERAPRKVKPEKLSARRRLYNAILQGSKDPVHEAVNALLKELPPAQIINGPMSEAMIEVGKQFSKGELIITEVLQSAQSMKAAVSALEPHLKPSPQGRKERGRMLLATVKGDVHDIGKNLVHIIFESNGFQVTDLGIKVNSEAIVEAALKGKPDLIGLSGLLVRSTGEMATVAKGLSGAGIGVPLLVGGAALTAKFAALKIAPLYDGPVFYAGDAMHGLDTAVRYCDPALREKLVEENRSAREAFSADAEGHGKSHRRGTGKGDRLLFGNKKLPVPLGMSPCSPDEIPEPPDLKRHLVDFRIESVFEYINPRLLYLKHLGLKGNLDRLFSSGDKKAVKLRKQVEELESEMASSRSMKAAGVYRFYPAQSEGNSILLFDPDDLANVAEKFDFPRQSWGKKLCLADFVSPRSGGSMDYIPLFVATCGEGIRKMAGIARDKGDYVRSHMIEVLAISCAEAFAETLHREIRKLWGFPEPPEMTMKNRFRALYRGKRFSFGYPACPDLANQARLFGLLQPEKDLKVKLTENFMMDPEASISAFVFHNPKAEYFSISNKGNERRPHDKNSGVSRKFRPGDQRAPGYNKKGLQHF